MRRSLLRYLLLLVATLTLLAYSGCDLLDTEEASRAPSVEIVSPFEDDLIAGVVPVFVQTEAFLNSPDNRIESVNIAIDGSPAGAATRTSFGSKPVFVYMWNTLGVHDGTHRLQAEASDSGGARGLSAVQSLTVENGLNNGPLVSIYQPVPNQEVFGVTVIRIAEIPNEPDVQEIDLLIDGITVATLQGPDYVYEWNTLLEAPGTHTIQAKSVGLDGLLRLSMVIPVEVTGG